MKPIKTFNQYLKKENTDVHQLTQNKKASTYTSSILSHRLY